MNAKLDHLVFGRAIWRCAANVSMASFGVWLAARGTLVSAL